MTTRTYPVITLLVLAGFLPGCALLAVNAAPTSVPAAGSDVPTEPASPTATPTAEPGLVLLLTDGQSEPYWEPLVTTLENLTAADGLLLQQTSLEGLTDLPSNTVLVISMGQVEGLTGLAGTFPQAHFVGLGAPPESAPSNLSGIVSAAPVASMEAFLAGYSSAVITDNYRVAIVVPEGEADTQARRIAFRNGVIFYCGLCRPATPPLGPYPITRAAPLGLDHEGATAVVQSLVEQGVSVAYIAPGLEGTALPAALAERQIVLTMRRRPPNVPDAFWGFALRPAPELAVQANWDAALTGTAEASWPLSVIVSDRNPAILTEGRAQAVAEIRRDLAAGYIDPGTAPE